MGFRGIRATPQRHIKMQSKSMALRRCIEEHLAGLKSTAKPSLDSRKPGYRGKETAYWAKEWLKNKGYLAVAECYRTPFAEIDLFCVHRNDLKNWCVFEIKSSAWPDGQIAALSPNQIERLKRARIWVESELVEVLKKRPWGFSRSEIIVELNLLVRCPDIAQRVDFEMISIF